MRFLELMEDQNGTIKKFVRAYVIKINVLALETLISKNSAKKNYEKISMMSNKAIQKLQYALETAFLYLFSN